MLCTPPLQRAHIPRCVFPPPLSPLRVLLLSLTAHLHSPLHTPWPTPPGVLFLPPLYRLCLFCSHSAPGSRAACSSPPAPPSPQCASPTPPLAGQLTPASTCMCISMCIRTCVAHLMCAHSARAWGPSGPQTACPAQAGRQADWPQQQRSCGALDRGPRQRATRACSARTACTCFVL